MKTVYYILGIAAAAGLGYWGYKKYSERTSSAAGKPKDTPCPNPDKSGLMCVRGQWSRNANGTCVCSGDLVDSNWVNKPSSK